MKRLPPGPHRAARIDLPPRQSWRDGPVYRQLMAFLGVAEDVPEGRLRPAPERARALVTALLLRAAWMELITDDGEDVWVDDWLSALGTTSAETAANRETAATLQRVLDQGVRRADLTRLVRAAQEDLLSRLCEVLDGQRRELLDEEMPEVEGLTWQLHARIGDETVGPLLHLAPRQARTDPSRSPAPSPSDIFQQNRPPGPGDDAPTAPPPAKKPRRR
jgi:hypothetical protein